MGVACPGSGGYDLPGRESPGLAPRIMPERYIDSWMAGDRNVKRILPVLAVLLVMSCSSSQKGSAGKGQPDSQDQKYNQALEYYTLTHKLGTDPNKPIDGLYTRPALGLDKQTGKRMVSLLEALRAWGMETPDTHVPHKDQEEMERLVELVFHDPMSRSQMVIKTYELKMCERVTYQFYNKNRCLVSITFYNRGPMIQAGLDLYAFKYNDRWQLIHRADWIR